MTSPLSANERTRYIDQYEQGPDELEAAYSRSPFDLRKVRPVAHEWSIHQIVCHCADAELLGAVRVRMLAADSDPVLVSIDQDVWANSFSYDALTAESALTLVRATRLHTAAILRSLPEQSWSKVGRHTESGPYSIIEWLTYWASHLHVHAEQIRMNVQQIESQR